MAILSENPVKIGDKDCISKICKQAKERYHAELHVDGELFDATGYCSTAEQAKGLLVDMIATYKIALIKDTPISSWTREVFLEGIRDEL